MSTLVNEIIPKPKTVLEFYEGHPERWTKGFRGRKDKAGNQVDTNAEACALCLGAALGFVYCDPNGRHYDDSMQGATHRLFRIARASDVRRDGFEEAYEAVWTSPWIVFFNDKPDRTFEEIVQICREARI